MVAIDWKATVPAASIGLWSNRAARNRERSRSHYANGTALWRRKRSGVAITSTTNGNRDGNSTAGDTSTGHATTTGYSSSDRPNGSGAGTSARDSSTGAQGRQSE